jgi:hypothetical protein
MSDIQGNSYDPKDAEDNGISISAERFHALATAYLARMVANEEMSPEDYITMTRLWNTIQHRGLIEHDELFGRYSAAFFPGYVERVSRSLNAYPTKGMALYSKEYDLFLGGKPHTHSLYKLEEEEREQLPPGEPEQ